MNTSLNQAYDGEDEVTRRLRDLDQHLDAVFTADLSDPGQIARFRETVEQQLKADESREFTAAAPTSRSARASIQLPARTNSPSRAGSAGPGPGPQKEHSPRTSNPTRARNGGSASMHTRPSARVNHSGSRLVVILIATATTIVFVSTIIDLPLAQTLMLTTIALAAARSISELRD